MMKDKQMDDCYFFLVQDGKEGERCLQSAETLCSSPPPKQTVASVSGMLLPVNCEQAFDPSVNAFLFRALTFLNIGSELFDGKFVLQHFLDKVSE